MRKVAERKTSVSLGSRSATVDKMRKQEDRSRSAVIRRAIDYYYLMNYVPEVEPTKGEIKTIEQGIADLKAGKGITLGELQKKYDLGTSRTTKSRKTIR